MGIVFGMFVFAGVVAVGVCTLWSYLKRTREVRKDTSGVKLQVRFMPKAFRVMVLVVAALVAIVSVGLSLVVFADMPPYVMSFGLILLVSLLRPAYRSKAGPLFVACEEGKDPIEDAAPPMPAQPADAGVSLQAQYPGFQNNAAGAPGSTPDLGGGRSRTE